MEKAFKHNFETGYDVIGLAQVVGYTQCLDHIAQYIKEKCPPEEGIGYLNAGKLMQVIQSTTLELSCLKMAVKTDMIDKTDDLLTDIKNILKDLP